MKANMITITVLFLLASVSIGQRTEVSVKEGKVRAATGAGTVIVEAGHKAVLSGEAPPEVRIDDPMVEDLLAMHQWVKAEKDANLVRIDSSSVQIVSIEGEGSWRVGGLNELANTSDEPSRECVIDGTLILEDVSYYDLSGHLLDYELEQTTELTGNYTVHFRQAVQPGDVFRFVVVGNVTPAVGFWSDGVYWHHVMENNPRYCVNYFRQILPPTAIFVDASQDVVSIDTLDGRVAVTTRNYTGAEDRGMVHTRFLWPAKDGTSLADLAEDLTIKGARESWQGAGATQAVEDLESIPWDGAGEEVLDVYDAFLREQVRRAHSWFELGIKLVGARQWDAALRSFRHCREFGLKDPVSYLSALIWEGHILDVLGERQQAILAYREAEALLEGWKGADPRIEQTVFMRHDQWGIQLSYNWVKARLDEPFTEAMLTAEPGETESKAETEKQQKQFEEVAARFETIPWEGAGPEVLEIYEWATANEDFLAMKDVGNGWVRLGLKLVGGRYWEQAFDCFRRAEELEDGTLYKFAAILWQGHIYDVWGRRDEALARYRQALEIAGEHQLRHDQWNIVINYGWVHDRLTEPFKVEMLNK
jgi:tetratricopeptide (TPR) repeat protein